MSVIKANSYSVYVGAVSETFLQSGVDLSKYSAISILADENTRKHCFPYLMQNVSGLEKANVIEIPAGEDNKNLEMTAQIWEALTELGADRKCLLINLGGGVIGDMGGFVASTYMRGIDFIQVPTTLLSQVDASVGGKLGIDFEGYKNHIGVFNTPKAVFIDPNFLKTLDERNFKSGFAEMLKHVLIADAKHWIKLAMLKSVDKKQIEKHIETSIKIKNAVVSADFKESGVRKILNFGHTIGHAVESIFLETDHELLHGEAVAIGMAVETCLSRNIGLMSDEEEEILSVLKKNFSLIKISSETESEILELVKLDKKNSNGNLNFTLLSAIGKAEFNCEINEHQISEAIAKYNRFVK
ncbi:MAG: 3-dehydroquinate synthase [Bacteroidia bacterium]